VKRLKRFIKLFDIRGLKIGLLLLTLGLNILLSFLLVKGLTDWIGLGERGLERLNVFLILGEFLIGYLIALGVTLVTGDQRGPSYGILGAVGSFVLVLILMSSHGLVGVIIAVSAVIGGYNGGVQGERLRPENQEN
jgi:hypothetical protein